MIQKYSLAIGMALLSASCFASTVNPLNGFTFSSTCNSVSTPQNAGCSVGNATVQYGLNSVTGPFASASLSAGTGGNTIGDLVYQIEVSGPTPTALVDVNYLLTVAGQFTQPLGNDESALLNTGAALAVGPYNIADTEIHVTASGGSVENGFPPSVTDTSVNASYSSKTGAWAGSSAGPDTLTLTTGIAYNVVLRVQADCTGQGTGSTVISCTTSAAVDPTFSIDPSQVNGSQYSILLSPGVGNGTGPLPSAPEPATLLLSGLGLIGVAILGRFRNNAKSI